MHLSDTNTSLCLGVCWLNLSVCLSGAEEVDVKAGRSRDRENHPTERPTCSSGRCECVRLCLRLCLVALTLTRLPWLPAEVEGNHIGGSVGTSTASHGETEVPALPENVQELVRSHPVRTSCSGHLPEENSFKLASHFWREAALV